MSSLNISLLPFSCGAAQFPGAGSVPRSHYSNFSFNWRKLNNWEEDIVRTCRTPEWARSRTWRRGKGWQHSPWRQSSTVTASLCHPGSRRAACWNNTWIQYWLAALLQINLFTTNSWPGKETKSERTQEWGLRSLWSSWSWPSQSNSWPLYTIITV